LREQGYLPQAIVNYLARLGHQYENLKFSDLKTLGEKISFATFSKSPAHYDEQHLHYWQKEAVLNISSEEFKAWLEHSNLNSLQSCPIDNPDFMKLMQENIVFPQEAARWAEILFTNNTEYTTEQLDLFKTTGKDFFKTASQYTAEAIANNNFDIKTLADLLKTKFNLSGKKLFMPLRLSLSMTDHGPELANLVALMGIKKVKERFDQVINLI
jgi:glutamyl-tRNA synthetase